MPILCVGQIVADIVVRSVDSMPQRGCAERVEELNLVAGGCAANTACVLAKLGVDVSIASMVGRDPMGDIVLSEIASYGIDISAVVRDAFVPTSAVVVLVSRNGERSFLYREGGNECLSLEMIPQEMLLKVDFAHIGGGMKLSNLDLAAFLTAARESGCVTSLDTDWDVSGNWLGPIEAALPQVDYLLTNVDEGRMLTGCEQPEEIGRCLLARGPRMVIIKRGPMGAIAMTDGVVEDFPAFDVQVADTTCAGDSFTAGFLFGLSQGWEIARAVRFANAAGALCTTQISHRAITSLSAVTEFLEARSSNPPVDHTSSQTVSSQS